MKIGLAQCDFTVGDLAGNLKKVLDVMQQAVSVKLDLLVFPELAITGYIAEDLLLREEFIQRAAKVLDQLRQHVGDMAVIVGCPLRLDDGHLYNCAVVLQKQKIIACYQKQLLPNYGVFDEKRYFMPGNKSCVFQLTATGPKFGLLICEDTWSTLPAAKAKQAGAEILISIHASPFSINKERERQEVYRAACQAAKAPMLACLLVGAQDDICFDGGSRALDANGNLLDQAKFFTEQLLVVELDSAGQIIANKKPPAVESDVARVYQALMLGVRDYIQKNHFKGALLGLSGGIDSALTLTLAIDAIGAENVTAVAMPSRYTSELSMHALRDQAKLCEVELLELSIEPMFAASLQTLAPAFENLPADKTEENIQARCRGVLLMALSNKTGKIVLTTGNKSEMATGYATLYGDMAGGFAALKDVPKTLVFELAKYRNSLKYQIPEEIITRPPSAELAPNQVDQDSLPPYDILDEILHRSIDLQQSNEQIIAAGFAAEMVNRIVRMIYLNEYKRRQAPPGIKITDISFTRERRYPITCGKWN